MKLKNTQTKSTTASTNTENKGENIKMNNGNDNTETTHSHLGDQSSCPVCTFNNSAMAKSIAVLTDGIKYPMGWSSNGFLLHLKEYSPHANRLPKNREEMMAEFHKIAHSLSYVLSLSTLCIQIENQEFVILLPEA